MNELALARVLAKARGEPPTDPAVPPEAAPAPEATPAAPAPAIARPPVPPGPLLHDADRLAALLDTRLDALREPLEVDSAIVGRIYLVANDAQAEEVRKAGGVPYLPAEVAILRDLRAAVLPQEWAKRLRAIHIVKVEFEGEVS